MSESPAPVHGYLDVVFSDRPHQVVSISELPFLIGRGRESGNHLAIDDLRISRKCAAISAGSTGIRIEDRGQLNGIFVNGKADQRGNAGRRRPHSPRNRQRMRADLSIAVRSAVPGTGSHEVAESSGLAEG